jgi:hypothetical protein
MLRTCCISKLRSLSRLGAVMVKKTSAIAAVLGPVLVVLALGWPCAAQDSPFDLRRDSAPRVAPTPDSSVGILAPTPEMWFYEQERIRHDDPKMAVRRRAEQRGQDRQLRLASQKWYGISNSRPTVSPTPWFAGYSDHWGSNTCDPLRWRMPTVPLLVTRPTAERY